MKYIKNFSIHREEKINEEFIGGLLKGLKNRLSLGFSKMFGKAKEADSKMKEYRTEIDKINKTRLDVLKEYSKYIKENKGNVDKDEIKRLNNEYNKIDKNYKEQLEILKQKFDLQFNNIIKDEKNEKIKNYITLKKLEMQQEILVNELNIILKETGLSEKELKENPQLASIVNSTKEKLKKSSEMAKKETEILRSEAPKEDKNKEKFEITDEKEIEMLKSENGWEQSPFVKGDVELKVGDEITYYKRGKKEKNYTSTDTAANTISKVGNVFVFIPSNDPDKEDLKIRKSKIVSKK
jgi:hypothetical protein